MPDTDTHGGQASGTQYLSIGEAAKLLAVSVPTLQRWDREGRLVALRTVTNQRRYRREDLVAHLPRSAAS